MYDPKTDTYTPEYADDLLQIQEFKADVVPWLNAPQINWDISVE